MSQCRLTLPYTGSVIRSSGMSGGMQVRFAKKSTPAPIEFTARMFLHCSKQPHRSGQTWNSIEHAGIWCKEGRKYHLEQLVRWVPAAEQPQATSQACLKAVQDAMY